jgi:hypothetical protein
MTNSGDNWQDYRGRGGGVLIHLTTTRLHDLPVTVGPSGSVLPDPNFNAGTFGFGQCLEARTRVAAGNSRRKYFLFGTRYQGTVEALRGRFLIIGAMRLEKMMEVRKRHVHRWMEKNTGLPPECMNLDSCHAFQSSELNFYAPQDAFELTEPLMKQWGYKGKITKQMKLTFTDDKVEKILGHFREKVPCNSAYQEAALLVDERATAEAARTSAKNESW